MEKIKIKLNGGIMPQKAYPTDAAYDLYTPEDVELVTGRQVINLLFSIELPIDKAATIQPRSGFASKGFEVTYILEDGTVIPKYRLDADVIRGLVDSGYRGNVGVIIKVNQKIGKDEKVIIPKGSRIAQMQIVYVPPVELVISDSLSDSDRSENGFGSSGIK